MNKHLARATQNREELLQAAAEMIKTHGIHVPLQLIIDHAGVGRATFYRNFSDRTALIHALLADSIENLKPRVARYENDDDGLFQLIHSHIENLRYLSALKEYWKVLEHDDPVLKQLSLRHQAIIQPLIDRAIAAKKCRPDLTFEDYRTIVSILASSFRGHTEQEQTRLAKRVLELLFVGIQISQDVTHG
ncbi:TetR/AcrR family transcriptional regulator [Acinetobacter sp. MD2(2019)]|uniref:TetR/AcrR family transcriptional regulator n=1 Tax=Acinetobacter sp. MD2(2019) TaxID=2605273 RepID=UPI002D1EAE7C|nr:TetR/AcrR family transcriptional regulator [Acinetobacter sp. MD2(2019)]MEB3754837.1 TetR/AcrR family transcriptional regulator [Acinetobacter sp. MD2(2019)]